MYELVFLKDSVLNVPLLLDLPIDVSHVAAGHHTEGIIRSRVVVVPDMDVDWIGWEGERGRHT